MSGAKGSEARYDPGRERPVVESPTREALPKRRGLPPRGLRQPEEVPL